MKFLFPMDDDGPVRQDNGVRKRMDGGGEPWAQEHRDKLPREFHMIDVDALYGSIVFAKNASEKLFAEYVPDSYENREQFYREFGLVALFDIKRSVGAARKAMDPREQSAKFYCWIARAVAQYQEVQPKFFFVVDEGPCYCYLEIDVWTGTWGPEYRVAKADNATSWVEAWTQMGLVKVRHELMQRIRQVSR